MVYSESFSEVDELRLYNDIEGSVEVEIGRI